MEEKIVHLQVMTLGYPRHIDRFIQWISSKKYRKEGWNVVPREYRFYDLVMPSCIEDKVIPDLLHFEARTLRHKAEPIMKWIRRFTVLDDIDRKQYKPSTVGEMGYYPIDGHKWWVYTYIMGKIHDKWVDGHEYI